MSDPEKFGSEAGLRLSMVDGPREIGCRFSIITIKLIVMVIGTPYHSIRDFLPL